MTKPKDITTTTSKSKSKPKNTFTSRYSKIKLSAEIIVVIKKALLNFKTAELSSERIDALTLLNSTDDYFIILYRAKEKRGHKRKHESTEKLTEADYKQLILDNIG
jgi:hypothetical protein